MLLIHQTATEPYFNIAAEEHLLKNFSEDIFILYRNEPSIIVGKHQNTLAEINLDLVRRKQLKVIRRLSGGGTVYHDLGNLNYTFIVNGSVGNLVNFKKFTQPIVDVLQGLGVDATLSGKNDIRIGDKKISGNAEHIYKSRTLHHGTLLFSSNLEALNEAIDIDPNAYSDKAVKSIRSHVTNLSDSLKGSITIDELADLIVNHIKGIYPNSHSFQFTNDDIDAIKLLVDNKYSTWEWNFAYSPSYTLSKQIPLGNDILKIFINVERGIISQISFEGNSLNKNKRLELEQILTGCPHDAGEIERKLMAVRIDECLPNIPIDKLLAGLL